MGLRPLEFRTDDVESLISVLSRWAHAVAQTAGIAARTLRPRSHYGVTLGI
jgi:hypothetical protein